MSAVGDTFPAVIDATVEVSEVGLTVWDDAGRFIVVKPENVTQVYPLSRAELIGALEASPIEVTGMREVVFTDPTNLSRAADIVAEIDRVRGVQRELRAAFARSELDGGAKAAPAHPLYVDAEAELERLHAALMILI